MTTIFRCTYSYCCNVISNKWYAILYIATAPSQNKNMDIKSKAHGAFLEKPSSSTLNAKILESQITLKVYGSMKEIFCWNCSDGGVFLLFFIYISSFISQCTIQQIFGSTWQLQLAMESVSITTEAVNSNPAQARCTQYNIM